MKTHTIWISSVSPAIIFFGIMLYFTVFRDLKEKRYQRKIKKLAMAGNKYALEIVLNNRRIYLEDKETIDEAISGNENALKILGIDKNKIKGE